MMTGWVQETGGFVITMLAHGTLLAFLTWVLCSTVLKQGRPALKSVLWTIVLLKFVVPPWLPGDYSLSNGIGLAAAKLWAGAPIPVSFPLLGRGGEAAWIIDTPGANLALWVWVGAFIYAAGLIWVMVRGLLRIRSFSRITRHLEPAPDGTCLEVDRLAEQLGLKRSPRVRVVHSDVAPLVCGLFRPVLILPEPLLSSLPNMAREAMILHELAHIRRKDLWVRVCQNLARVLFFFWPPVWWVCRCIERFSEMACDQWAVSLTRISPDAYAQSLLDVVKRLSGQPSHEWHVAFARKGRLLEERFDMILKKNQLSPRFPWLAFPFLVLWVTFALVGPPQPQRPGSESEPRARSWNEIEAQEGRSPNYLPEFLLREEGYVGKIFRAQGKAADGTAYNLIIHLDPEPGDGESEPNLSEEPQARKAKLVRALDSIRFGVTVEKGQTVEYEPVSEMTIGLLPEKGANVESFGLQGKALEVEVVEAAVKGLLDGALKRTKPVKLRVLLRPSLKTYQLIEKSLPVTEDQARAESVRLARVRRAQLLAKYPEADIDEDGVLSKSEAEKLALKLRSIKRP